MAGSELHPLKVAALVALGGAGGALARYYVSVGMRQWLGEGWPWGTFIVNVVGCLVLGLLAGMADRELVDPAWRAAVMVGFLGAFTTFSTFSLEGVKLLKQADSPTVGLLYLGVSVVVGVLLAAGGYWLGGLRG